MNWNKKESTISHVPYVIKCRCNINGWVAVLSSRRLLVANYQLRAFTVHKNKVENNLPLFHLLCYSHTAKQVKDNFPEDYRLELMELNSQMQMLSSFHEKFEDLSE